MMRSFELIDEQYGDVLATFRFLQMENPASESVSISDLSDDE